MLGGCAGRAFPRSPDLRELARPVARIDSLITVSRVDSAQALIDIYLPSARAEADSGLLLFLLSRRGRAYASFDRAREAEPPLREAAELAEALRDTATLCLAFRWLGVSVDQQGRRGEAREINTRLRGLARAIGDRKDEAWAIFGLGWQAEQDGAYDEACDSYQTALEIFREVGESGGEIWAWNGLGSIAQRRGDFDGATEGYRRSMRRAVEVGHVNGELRALNNLGTVEFLRGDPDRALEAFQRARDLQVERGNRYEAAIPALNVAICLTHLGRLQEAEAGLLEWIDLSVREGWRNREFSLRSQLARVYFNKEDYPAAARAYRECLAMGDALPVPTRIQVAYGLSNALGKMDSSAAGLAVLDRVQDSARGGVGDEMAVYLDGTRGLRLLEMGRPAEALPFLLEADRGAERLGLTDARLYALPNGAIACRRLGMADSSLAMLQRARVVWEAERQVSASPDWREARGSLGSMIYTDLAAGLTKLRPGGVVRDNLAEAFDQLQAFKARTLLDRMRGPQPTLDPGGSANHDSTEGVPSILDPVIGLSEMQRDLLGPDEVFLDCYLGPEQSIVFAVTRDDALCAAIPPESALVERIQTYREILTSAADGNGVDAPSDELLGATARNIDSLLFGGAAVLMRGKKRVIISPDGPLHRIPFGLGEAAGANADDARRWIRIPSATILSAVRGARHERTGRRPGSVLALRGLVGSDGGALDGARAEIAHLARRFEDVDTRLPEGRDGASPWSALADYDLIHIAAHARILDQAPWQSTIAIAGGADSGLVAREVADLRLRATLVVLSSCESAGGGIRAGEGVAGLTSAFLAAGAPAVVSTLWPVDDRVTTGFMEAFYEAIADGHPAGEALGIAQREIRSRPATRAPFYWAGFVLAGNDMVPLVLRRRPGVGIPAAVALAALLAVAGVGIYRGRRRGSAVTKRNREGPYR